MRNSRTVIKRLVQWDLWDRGTVMTERIFWCDQCRVKELCKKSFLCLFRHAWYLLYYPSLTGHPGETHMYDTMGRECYWPHMAMTCSSLWVLGANELKIRFVKNLTDAYNYSCKGLIGIRHPGHIETTVKDLEQKTVRADNERSILKINERCITVKKAALHIASLFMDHWVIS